ELKGSCLALNDIVIQRSNLSQVEMYKIGVNDYTFEPKAADGIVVSTPTGSTAYALSLGGPIIFPESRTMQLNLIAPHTIANRSLVFNSKEKISICLDNDDELKYSVDGLPLEMTKKIYVGLSDKEFKLMYPETDDILKLVESKLLWGRRG
ncbi:MAG: NAD(+)/NADH kinase, partial [Thermotogota bacterium]